MYRALLHQTSITYWERRRPFPTNRPQVYWALLHQTSRPYWGIHTYPVQMDSPIEPKCTKAYNTTTCITYWERRRPSPTNWLHVYRALLHPTSIIYWEIHIYPVKPWSLLIEPQVYRALLHQTMYNLLRNEEALPPLIDPKCTEPYYTKPADPIEEYTHTQCRWMPQLSPSVQRPTTPHQYNLLRKEESLPH